MNQTIRDFRETDREEYIALSKAFYSSDAVLHMVPEMHFNRTFDECLEKNPYLRGLVLVYDGAFAGYALLSLTWSNEAGGLCVLLEEASIKSEFQGQGLGSWLLEQIEQEYSGTAKRLRLEVTHSNTAAIRLYERLGYEELNYLQMVKDL